MSLAWHIVALPRQKKFPELQSLLIKKPQQRRQSHADMARILENW